MLRVRGANPAKDESFDGLIDLGYDLAVPSPYLWNLTTTTLALVVWAVDSDQKISAWATPIRSPAWDVRLCLYLWMYVMGELDGTGQNRVNVDVGVSRLLHCG